MKIAIFTSFQFKELSKLFFESFLNALGRSLLSENDQNWEIVLAVESGLLDQYLDIVDNYSLGKQIQITTREFSWESIDSPVARKMFPLLGYKEYNYEGIDRVNIPYDEGWNFCDCDHWFFYDFLGKNNATIYLRPSYFFLSDSFFKSFRQDGCEGRMSLILGLRQAESVILNSKMGLDFCISTAGLSAANISFFDEFSFLYYLHYVFKPSTLKLKNSEILDFTPLILISVNDDRNLITSFLLDLESRIHDSSHLKVRICIEPTAQKDEALFEFRKKITSLSSNFEKLHLNVVTASTSEAKISLIASSNRLVATSNIASGSFYVGALCESIGIPFHTISSLSSASSFLLKADDEIEQIPLLLSGYNEASAINQLQDIIAKLSKSTV